MARPARDPSPQADPPPDRDRLSTARIRPWVSRWPNGPTDSSSRHAASRGPSPRAVPVPVGLWDAPTSRSTRCARSVVCSASGDGVDANRWISAASSVGPELARSIPNLTSRTSETPRGIAAPARHGVRGCCAPAPTAARLLEDGSQPLRELWNVCISSHRHQPCGLRRLVGSACEHADARGFAMLARAGSR